MFVYLLERLYTLICHHEWIRERRVDGTLGQRCMRCLRRREYNLAQLAAWSPHNTVTRPNRENNLPAPLGDDQAA